MGFHVTSVNYNDNDYIEYEVVRGTNTFEIQIDVNEKTKKGTEIEIDPNIVQAEATEKALANSQSRMTKRKAVPITFSANGRGSEKQAASARIVSTSRPGSSRNVRFVSTPQIQRTF